MKLLIVSATEFEILPLLEYLNKNYKNKDNRRFFSNKIDIYTLITGVGTVHTTFSLATFLAQKQFDLAVNVGIAGAFNRNLNIGDVLQVINDRFADTGVEEADGTFTDTFEMQLTDWNEAPYVNGKLYSPILDNHFLPQVSSITVNKVAGTAENISKINQKYPADLESMEGAAFFYCCLLHQIDCMQIRSVSNYVEPRNKDNWNIPLAIDNLNDVLIEMIKSFNE